MKTPWTRKRRVATSNQRVIIKESYSRLFKNIWGSVFGNKTVTSLPIVTEPLFKEIQESITTVIDPKLQQPILNALEDSAQSLFRLKNELEVLSRFYGHRSKFAELSIKLDEMIVDLNS